MQQRKKNIPFWLPEVLFQLGLLTIVYIFFAYEKQRGSGNLHFDIPKTIFYLNYVLASMFINYVLLPKFLYRKNYLQFILWSTLTITAVIFIEEGIIEQIFYPETRGKRFSSVFNNLISALPSITILVGFKFAYDAIRQQRELEVLQSAVKESELQFLKTQINPHFLFNNLNNLYSYALEQSSKTPEIILELSGVLRYMLYECQEATVPLHKEIEQLENFINLSKLQLEERGQVTFRAQDVQHGFRIAPLILSVFIENAFKHSASSQSDNIEIDVRLNWKSENEIIFTCENSYSEVSNTQDLSKGIGLANVQKRLELLYPDKHELKIDQTSTRYKVELHLELENGET